MKKPILFLLISVSVTAQDKLWTENDRQGLIANLKKTRDSLVKETQNLSTAQWNFRESPERWTIGEIVEHLSLWERIFARETNIALRSKPTPELNSDSKPDSWYIDFIMEEKIHNAPDYARPTGLMQGKDNLATFLKIRERTLRFAETTAADLKVHFEPVGGDQYRNVHQIFIVQWGHVYRHIKQIKKVKNHPNYPKQ